MKTEAELVGGCADGVRLEPDDPEEPDDWPDCVHIGGPNNAQDVYFLRKGPSTAKDGVRVYFYDVDRWED